MEGGGDSREGKARLRQGMSEFLRSLRKSAGHKRLSWKIVACGSRNEAHGVFLNATMTATEIFNVLLVNSEGPVAHSPRAARCPSPPVVRRRCPACDRLFAKLTGAIGAA